MAEARPLSVHHAPVGIALLDPASRIVHANAALQEFLGHEGSDLLGRQITDFVAPEDAEATVDMICGVMAEDSESGATAKVIAST